MAKVVISHKLHDDGMAVLERAGANVVITNSGKPEDMLPELLDADGLIIRIGSIDRETMLKYYQYVHNLLNLILCHLIHKLYIHF